MILKAGTYRWNDTIDLGSHNTSYALGMATLPEMYLPFFTEVIYTGEDGTTFRLVIQIIMLYTNPTLHPPTIQMTVIQTAYNENGEIIEGPLEPTVMYPYKDDAWDSEYEFMRDVTVSKDYEVDDVNGAWFIESTNYNDVNAKPLAEITYNGETIAQLNAGETCTIKCGPTEDTKYVMASDVVVKVNEVESKIPEGYIKPEGTLQVVSNNTTVDVTNYAKIAVRTAKPREIETESQFNAILSDSSGITGTSAGDVFMYIGETTDSYENGTLYYLEDTEK